MLRKQQFRTSAVAILVAVAAGLLAGPAHAAEASGPKNPQEAAICASLLKWALPSSPAPTSIDAVCTVKGNGG
ncbi:hypothetical protein [Kitasatospora sp. NPDC057223]|uniref:hypothetical protein n=1 Tax=Kitasatospora sp. NPDC057223 TaxID=3346055 RepID=UPI00363F1A00